jgi:hypothetical protein
MVRIFQQYQEHPQIPMVVFNFGFINFQSNNGVFVVVIKVVVKSNLMKLIL